jgi:phosphoribosylglycinamide formyltransferase-1
MTEEHAGSIPLPIAVLISGSGTNLQAILDAISRGEVDAEVRLVVSSNPDAGGLERARQAGVATRVLRSKDFENLQSFRKCMLEAFVGSGVKLLVLAGYMKRLPKDVLRTFDGRVINIHPALLPDFGGKGFFGLRVHEAVIAAGRKVSGATVHIVNERYDEGPILLQREVPVEMGDTPESLAKRVLAVEHKLLPEAVQAFAEGRVTVEGDKAWVVSAEDR